MRRRVVPHAMINRDHCGKCGRPTVVSFAVEPEAAWTTVVLNRWRTLCPSCFDIEAHKARVQYTMIPANDNNRAIWTGAFVWRQHWPLVLAGVLFGIAVSAGCSLLIAS